MPRLCVSCGEPIPLQRIKNHAKYCSNNCRYRKYYVPHGHNIPTGTVGAIQELRVAADLLLKGYDVFRAMSPSCSCDLAVLKDGKLLRVEVTTGNRWRNGNVFSSKDSMVMGEKFDILAIVVDGKIEYSGAIP